MRGVLKHVTLRYCSQRRWSAGGWGGGGGGSCTNVTAVASELRLMMLFTLIRKTNVYDLLHSSYTQV